MKVSGRGKREKSILYELGVVAHVFNPRALETEEGGSLLVLGHLGLHSECQDSQGCVERPYFNIY